MKNLIYCALILIVSVLPAFGQAGASAEGKWLGTLEFNGVSLRLALKVAKEAGGSLTATFDSIDQGATNLTIETFTQKDKAVSFEAPKYGLSYEGTINEKGDEITGTFKQGAGSQVLVFRRINELPKINRPQDPQKPYPYNEEDVSYKNTKDDVRLAGTLTTPRGEGRFPAVILITGSGGQDRNETVAGHHPFLVLADYLTRKGIAVLRVDDRGIGGSDAGLPNFTSESFAGDVLAGVEYLKTRKEINPKQIGLIGHSEGGMIAPMVAASSKDVAFIVLLAGLGQTGADVIYTQTDLLNRAGGASEFVTAQTIKILKNVAAILKDVPDNKRAEQKIDEMLAAQSGEFSTEQKKEFAPAEASIKAQIPMYVSSWFRYFIAYDPRPTLQKVKTPVLALNGENDLQVAYKENLGLIEAGLKAGGNKDVTVKSFPKLNHLFQTSGTGLLSEYEKIEETMSPVVLETIADWILKRTK
ncbi:MAG TPA: alpha/beta fold hydrolase [Pyrinomonadaceae bacterium]|jgi:pimeloyl-ACP methyl ester carboxylesterase